MRRCAWAALIVLLIAAASCSRLKREETVDRHRVDTEFIVE